MANNLYYPSRNLIPPLLGRQPDQKQVLEVYDHAAVMVNTVVAIANEAARIAISDGIDALKKEDGGKLYRFSTKHWCKETFARQERYENEHLRIYEPDQQKMWLDFLDSVEEAIRLDIFKFYMSLKSVLDKHRQKRAALKAKLETGRVIAEVAVDVFRKLMAQYKRETGFDYTPFFQQYCYDDVLKLWKKVCDIYVRTDNPDDYINLNDDRNATLAWRIIATKITSEKFINGLGKTALGMNMETARKYTTEQELNELMNSD